jgi:hypothetical protein
MVLPLLIIIANIVFFHIPSPTPTDALEIARLSGETTV